MGLNFTSMRTVKKLYQVTENMPKDVKDKYQQPDIKKTSEGTVTTFAFTITHEIDKTKLTVVKNWIDEGEMINIVRKKSTELTADGKKSQILN